MNFERGSKPNPTGNLIAYCHVFGENPIAPGGKIIASNVVVSFLKIGDNYPVVTFPPVALSSKEELLKILTENIHLYDVVQLPDFQMPDDKDQSNQYIQERMEQFNSMVMRYVEYCKAKEKKQATGENEKLEGFSQPLETLANLSLEFRSSSGIAKEATRLKMDRIVDYFLNHHPQLDIDNFQKALAFPGKLGDELVSLYIQKFNAIQIENYEGASDLRRRILAIESMSPQA
ncbi:hypothetical protein LPTSP3_g24090 [Leptospira kobayashii]|uniref:Uncharacterized protein n=1 Tax=Leptospira kobayashii TaxID=1917830 RepID=A0ABN6KG59_9LEPT|nr:hypothetical protein [Leptospira kobayashii]BDA79479.1 hypothetical protein LPTSP3_g24090 [Leptospira kobayashii]